ncbi:small membrane A-kinase anchor protein [Petromyzon marinus]|uniref:small membrane A-kinase anchor protein n=1 Tax=Petromyzon marinus TaxID=7757 RepID=UPI003F7303E3
MGCLKSKNHYSLHQDSPGMEKSRTSSRVVVVATAATDHQQQQREQHRRASDSGAALERVLELSSPAVEPQVVGFAQKLSEQIMAGAMRQSARIDRCYHDIPYIENG